MTTIISRTGIQHTIGADGRALCGYKIAADPSWISAHTECRTCAAAVKRGDTVARTKREPYWPRKLKSPPSNATTRHR